MPMGGLLPARKSGPTSLSLWRDQRLRKLGLRFSSIAVLPPRGVGEHGSAELFFVFRHLTPVMAQVEINRLADR
jgi:hypothetical protein